MQVLLKQLADRSDLLVDRSFNDADDWAMRTIADEYELAEILVSTRSSLNA